MRNANVNHLEEIWEKDGQQITVAGDLGFDDLSFDLAQLTNKITTESNLRANGWKRLTPLPPTETK